MHARTPVPLGQPFDSIGPGITIGTSNSAFDSPVPPLEVFTTLPLAHIASFQRIVHS